MWALHEHLLTHHRPGSWSEAALVLVAWRMLELTKCTVCVSFFWFAFFCLLRNEERCTRVFIQKTALSRAGPQRSHARKAPRNWHSMTDLLADCLSRWNCSEGSLVEIADHCQTASQAHLWYHKVIVMWQGHCYTTIVFVEVSPEESTVRLKR